MPWLDVFQAPRTIGAGTCKHSKDLMKTSEEGWTSLKDEGKGFVSGRGRAGGLAGPKTGVTLGRRCTLWKDRRRRSVLVCVLEVEAWV